MAGTASKIFNIIVATKGAKNSEEALNRINKSQTRLGQSSASAARSFSAQASGLGGLVGIYAAAAATVFALEAAFTALNNAAAAENIVRGTNTLAATYGQAGPKILKNIKDITSGQITMADAAAQANLALAAGFSGAQIEKLTVIATKASRALGRDLTDSMNRIVRGSVKMEAELLDELGIFTKIGPATTKYAKELGVATTALTDFERRQAFLNAVTEEGIRKYNAIDTTVKSTQKTLKQMVVSLQEMGTAFLQTVGNAIEPFVSFIKNTAGAELLAFAGVMLLVFNKLLQGVGALVQGGLNKLQTFAAVLSGISQTLTATPARLQKSVTLFNRVIERRGGIVGTGLDSTTGGSFAKGLKREESQTASAARNRFMSGDIPALGSEQREKDIRALRIAQDKLTAANRGTSQAFRDAGRILRIYQADVKRTTALTGFLNSAVTRLSGFVRVASIAFAGFSQLMSGIGLIISAIQIGGLIAGRDFIGEFIEKTKKAREALAKLEAGISGSAFFAGGGSTQVKNRLEVLGLSEDEISDAGAKLVDLSKSVYSKALGELARTTRKGVAAFINDPIAMQTKQLDVVTKMIKGKKAELNEQPLGDVIGRREIQADLVLLETLRDKLTLLGNGYDTLVGQLALPLGLDTEDVINTLKDLTNVPNAIKKATRQVDGSAKDTIEIFGQVIPVLANGSMTIEGLTEKQQEYVQNSVSFLNVMRKLKDDFDSGSISLDEYSARLSSANSVLAELKKVIPQGLYNLFFKDADLVVSKARVIQETFRSLENLAKGVESQFSSAIQAIGKFPFSGLISQTGAIAKTNEEQLKNQISYLKDIIKATDNIIGLNSADEAARNLNLQSRRALTGLLIQNVQQMASALDKQQKISKQLNNQLNTLRLQNKLSKEQAQIALTRIKQDVSIKAAEQQLKLDELQVQNSKTRADLEKQQAENTLKALTKQRDTYIEILKLSIQVTSGAKEFAAIVAGARALQNTPTNISGGANTSFINQLMLANDIMIQGQQEVLSQTLKMQDIQNARKQQELAAERNIINDRLKKLDENNTKELANLKTRQNIEQDRIANQISILESEKKTLQTRQDIELLAAKIQKDNQTEQVKNVQRLIDAFGILANGIEQFGLSVQDLGDIAARIDPRSMAGFQAMASPTDFMESAKELEVTLQKQLISDAGTVNQIYLETTQNVRDRISLEKQGIQTRIDGLNAERNLNDKIFAQQKEQLTLRQQQEKESLQTRLNELSFTPDMSAYVEELEKIRSKASEVITKFGDISAAARQSISELNLELIEIQLQAKLDKSAFDRDMAMLKQEAALDMLQLQVKLVQAKVGSGSINEIEGAKQENKLQQSILDKRKEIIALEYSNALAANEEQRKLLNDQKVRDLQAVENRKNLLIAEINRDEAYIIALTDTYKTYISEQQTIYANFLIGLTDTWNRVFGGLATILNVAPVTIGAIQFNQIESALSDVAFEVVDSAQLARSDVEARAAAEKTVLEAKHTSAMDNLDREDEKAKIIHDNKMAALGVEGKIETEQAKQRVKDVEEASKVENELTGRLANIQSSFSSSISSAMTSLNDFIVYGEGSMRDAIGGFFRSIQETVLENTIVEPIANKLSHWLTGGLNQALGGTDLFGSSLAGVAGSAVGTTGDALKKNTMGMQAFGSGEAAMANLGVRIQASGSQAAMQINNASMQVDNALRQLGIKSQTSSVQSGAQIQTSGTQLATKVTTTGQQVAQGTVSAGAAIGSAGMTFTSLLQSFWPMLIMMGVTSLLTRKKAAGGSIQKLAAGGGASLRDRVPALLEPGEFVIRKPSARKIGMPALQHLNATGQMGGGAGNVVVNMVNEGSPKEAQASAPKFDGEKYVIDIVTRDLANNGPIRRSLRGSR